MDAFSTEPAPIVPEHFLASLYGVSALALGAAVWSAMAALLGVWALPAVPGLGWLVAWACRYGGRCTDAFVRVTAWLQAIVGVLLALFAFSAFSVTQGSPDSGFGLHAVGLECWRLFSEPPWLGSAAVLLTLAGARRALRDRPGPRSAASPALGLPRTVAGVSPGALRAASAEPGSRAA